MNNTKDNLEYRGITKEELLYSEKQPTYQLNFMSGCIGYVKGEIKKRKNAAAQGPLKNDAFIVLCEKDKTEDFFESYVFSMKELNKLFLFSHIAVRDFCSQHTEFEVKKDGVCKYCFTFTYNGFAYYVTLLPGEDVAEYNVVIYNRTMLYEFREKAGKGIRFVKPNYEEVFRIEDGGSIEIAHCGEVSVKKCRYYDDYHFAVDGNVFHICEFAEKVIANSEYTVKPIKEAV